MARSHGKDAVFKIDDSGGTLRDISNHVDNVSGLPGARAMSELTSYGDTGDRFIPGTQGTRFTVTGQFDSAALTGSATVLNSLRTAANTATYEYGPEGSTASDIKYTGECWMENFTVDASVKEKVPFSATFVTDNAITVSAF